MTARSLTRRALRIAGPLSCAITLSVLGGASAMAQQYPPASVQPVVVPQIVVDPAPIPAAVAPAAPTTVTTVTTVAPVTPLKPQVLAAVVTQPSVAPAAVKAEVATVAGLSVASPAYTGSNAKMLSAVGVSMFAVGGALLVASRRRRRTVR